MSAPIQTSQEIARIRAELLEIGRSSHTTLAFQDDLLNVVELEATQGGKSLIEVGCYLGGLTAQLAFAAKQLGLRFDVIDINAEYLAAAEDSVNHCGLRGYASFNLMDLQTFVNRNPDYGVAAAVFVDGDHRYAGVVADILAIKSMSQAPQACVFHDYSLRYDDPSLADVRVDKAISDTFGPKVLVHPLGERAGTGGLVTHPGADRHFHEVGMSEGALVRLA